MEPNHSAMYLLIVLVAAVGIRLLVSRDSREAARGDLPRLAQAHRGPGLRVAAVALTWLATLGLVAEAVIRFGAEAPAALPALRTLGACIAMITTIAAGLVWVFGARRPLFELASPGLDRRLSEAARRLGVSTGEAAVRAIDAGLPALRPEWDWGFAAALGGGRPENGRLRAPSAQGSGILAIPLPAISRATSRATPVGKRSIRCLPAGAQEATSPMLLRAAVVSQGIPNEGSTWAWGKRGSTLRPNRLCTNPRERRN